MKIKIPVQGFNSAGVMNRHQVWKVIGLTLLVCGLQLSGAQGVTFITFYVTGADLAPATVTFPTAINPTGVITGNYTDSTFLAFHGFVRALDGTITIFDAPGASTQPSQGTLPTANNPEGVITGYYAVSDSFGNTITHGFLRATNGALPASIPRVRPSPAILLCLILAQPQWPT
jgi:hypothetical protein